VPEIAELLVSPAAPSASARWARRLPGHPPGRRSRPVAPVPTFRVARPGRRGHRSQPLAAVSMDWTRPMRECPVSGHNGPRRGLAAPRAGICCSLRTADPQDRESGPRTAGGISGWACGRGAVWAGARPRGAGGSAATRCWRVGERRGW